MIKPFRHVLVNSLMAKLFLNTDLQRQPGGPNICLTLFQQYTGITNIQRTEKYIYISLPGDYRVTDEALIAETTQYDPSSFLRMFSLLLKDLISDFICLHCS